ncbi:MAG: hypothetical protein SGILL_004345 [Bacillariaceae sp.]
MCVVSTSSCTSTSWELPPKTSRVLAADYRPGRCTVVVGKGHLAQRASGNSALRQLVQSSVKTYSIASSKNTKSNIVSDLFEQVKDWNPDRIGFVKRHKGRWFETSDQGARDIITARFRDALADQYRSSTRRKVAKRRDDKASRRATKTADRINIDASSSSSTVPSSSASVISLTDNSESNSPPPQAKAEFEPISLNEPEPEVSSSFFKLEGLFQSRDDSTVVPDKASSSSAPPTPARVSFGSRRSSKSISEAVKIILGDGQRDVAPFEPVVNDLLEIEAGEHMEFWADDMLV